MTLLQQLLPSNNTVGSRLPLVIVMNFKSLPLFFIPDHRRGSLDVWLKDEPTFAGGREPRISTRWVLPPQQHCVLYYPTHPWTAAQSRTSRDTAMAFEMRTSGDQCAASAEKQRWGASRNKRGKDPWRWSHSAETYLMSEINRSVPLSPRMERKHVSLMEKSHLTYISWPSHSKQACPWNERRRTEPFV